MLETIHNGRYKILERLGQGGMGAVYKAEDSVQDHFVAIKIVRSEDLDNESLARFKREGQSMGSMAHPHIVGILETGAEDGSHFIVMEYLEGQNLKAFLAAQPDQRVTMELAVDIIRQIAGALEYAHTHNILHRDIKPTNIMISDDHLAKLADFGIAKSLGLSTLTQTGDVIGTAAYMAPEQALGGTFDARSDLYALGCVLYELIAGQRIFPGRNPARLIFSHINDTPSLPRRVAVEISPILEAILFKLLAKSPEERFQSATDLLKAFDDVDRESTPETVAMQTVEKRWTQVLIARDDEMAFLRKQLDDSIGNRGGLVFLAGETGIGKSRLAHQLETYASMRGTRFLEGRARHQIRRIPYQPWLEILRATLRLTSPNTVDLSAAGYLQDLAKLVPEFGKKAQEEQKIESIPQEQQQDRLFNAIANYLINLSDHSPLLLFLDDIHLADETSMQLLEFLVQKIHEERILVLGAYREDELRSQRFCANVVTRIIREPNTELLALKRLDKKQTAELIRKTFSGQKFRDLEKLVFEKTEGNPYFVEQLLRSLLDAGHVILEDGRWSVGDLSHIEVPEGIRSVVEDRLEQLQDESLEVLSLGAVIGREFDFITLQAVLEMEEDHLVELIDEALQANIVVPRARSGEEVYGFRDAAVEDVLYESISPVKRSRHHKKIGAIIERAHAKRLDDFAESLAHHFLEGHDEAKAATYSNLAGDKAAGVYAWNEARKNYELALELLPEEKTKERATIHQKLSPIISLESPLASIVHAKTALELYEELDDKRMMIDMHMFIQSVHMFGFWDGAREDEALKHLQAATALAEEFPDSMEQGLLYQRSAHLLLHRSQPRESLVYAQSALDLFEKLDVEMGTSKGTALAYMGRIDEGITHSEGNWDTVLRAGVPLVIGLFGHELSLSLALVRNVQQAKQWGEKVLDKVEGAGSTFEGFLLRPLVMTYTLIGEIENAQRAAKRELEIEKEIHLGCYLEDTAAIGLYYLRTGEHDRAKAHLQSAIERHEKRSTISAVAGCRFALGSLYLEEEKFIEAEEMLRWGLEACQAGDNVLFEHWILPVLAETYLKMGDSDRAAEMIDRGSALLTPDRNWYGLPAPLYTAMGMLSGLQKDWEIAEKHFAAAVTVNQEYRLPWDEAKALFEWGMMEGQRKRKQQAGEKFEQAEAIFRRISARWDIAKIEAAKGQLGGSWISKLRK